MKKLLKEKNKNKNTCMYLSISYVKKREKTFGFKYGILTIPSHCFLENIV
jgi:hypothetical protein